MDILLPQSVATVVEYYSPLRPTSATCRLLSPSGAEIATPAATVDALSATISAVTDAESVTVTVGTGSIVAGRKVWWVSADGPESRVLIGQKDSTAIKLEWPVARSLPEVNDTLKGARITATMTALATAARGENYAIEWTTTHADGSVFVERRVAHVVRAQARAPCDVGFVKAALVTSWPGVADNRTFGFFADMAERVCDRVWRHIRSAGRYVHLLWDASDTAAACRVALEYELSMDKLNPAGAGDLKTYRDGLDAELTREVERIYSSRPYDEDDSGGADSTEIRTVNAISLRRE